MTEDPIVDHLLAALDVVDRRIGNTFCNLGTHSPVLEALANRTRLL